MEGKVLVAYASKYGSTQEVADCVAETLRERGVVTDLQPLREVKTLAGYGAIALGAPLYMLRWHKDALDFLARFRAELPGLPVAVFALGPFHDKPEEWQEVRNELDKELAKHPWLSPVSIKIVGGKFDPLKLRFPWSWVPALKQMPASDLRDWNAIRAWSQELAGMFVERLAVKEAAQ